MFRSSAGYFKEALKFVGGFLLCYGLQFLATWLLTDHSFLTGSEWTLFGMVISGYGISTLVGMVVYTLANFVYNKAITFAGPTATNWRQRAQKKNEAKNAFFCSKILSVQEKCLPLQRNRENNRLTVERDRLKDAKIAQLVEHDLAKVGVAGSSPVFRSNRDHYLIETIAEEFL